MRTRAALGAVIATFVLAAPANASLVGWGVNGHGELGAGFKGPPRAPLEAAPSLAGAVQVVSTYFSSYALMPDGTVWAWGGNVWGQLGDGDRITHIAPVRVQGLAGVKEIAAGGAHAIALLSTGRVATWGADGWGTLGNGTTAHGRRGTGVQPGLVPLFPNVQGAVAVAAAGADDAVLLANGTVLAWGENRNGQLGDGTTVSRSIAVRVAGLTGVSAISTSADHSLALLSDGSVLAWGGDTFGQLGVRPTALCHRGDLCVLAPVRTSVSASAISAGRLYSLVLSHGQVLAFGVNARLLLGQAGPARTKPTLVPGLSAVTAIAAGEYHSLALGSLG